MTAASALISPSDGPYAPGSESVRVAAPDKLVSPLVFASPHSGRAYPDDLLHLSRLDQAALRRSEDAYVDELFAAAPTLGAPLICAQIARAYVDVNRDASELDPAMYAGPLSAEVNARSPRVAAGLGAIPRVVSEGAEIYRGKLPAAEAHRRIETVWRPYHAALDGALKAARAAFGCAILIDCHSMPSIGAGDPPADIVLGDRFGAACAPEITRLVESVLQARGLRVARNAPYAGGFATQTHGRPGQKRHALQIEINRALYMDEARCVASEGFARTRETMAALIQALTGAGFEKRLA
jgi:N-formylglutamate amidohydrolase